MTPPLLEDLEGVPVSLRHSNTRHDSESLDKNIKLRNMRTFSKLGTWLFQAFQSGVKISIRKQKPIEETTVQAVEPIIQHHGPWERTFEFENATGCTGRFDDFDEEDLAGTMWDGSFFVHFVVFQRIVTVIFKKSPRCFTMLTLGEADTHLQIV